MVSCSGQSTLILVEYPSVVQAHARNFQQSFFELRVFWKRNGSHEGSLRLQQIIEMQWN